MSLTLQRIGIVVLNARKLCDLLNVADEEAFLKQCMQQETFQECLRAGDTNMAKSEVLCEKMIQQIISGNTKIYDALCQYFLERSEAYKSMLQLFNVIGSSSSNVTSNESSAGSGENVSISLQRVGVVVSSTEKLCGLLNVVDDEHFLQQSMTPDAIQDCIQGGDTNLSRVQVLCWKIVKDLADGNMKVFDALCKWFARRAEDYKSMHERFTDMGERIAEVDVLQEKVKDLSEEVQYWRQLHDSPDSQSYSANRKRKLNNDVRSVLRERNENEEMHGWKRMCSGSKETNAAADDAPRSSCQTTGTSSVMSKKSQLTDEEMLQFVFEDLAPVEGNSASDYSRFLWQEENWLRRWDEILHEENHFSRTLALPPCVLNEEIIEDLAIVIFGRRYRNEFWTYALFHSNVLLSVSPLNVQVEVSLTFTRKDNTTWNVDKKIVATVERGDCLLFTLYDVPFDSFSSSSPPAATKISIKGISPDQKWCYRGLSAESCQYGQYRTINCNFLQGAVVDCSREWKKMVEDGTGFLPLPPLQLKGKLDEDVVVCMSIRRKEVSMHFFATFHPSTSKDVKPRELLFKIDFNVSTREKEILIKNEGVEITLRHYSSGVTIFPTFPWPDVISSECPRIRVCILPST